MVVKAAILREWVRLFVPTGTRGAFFWACHAILWFNVLFYSAILIAADLACTPFAKIWDKTLDGVCLDEKSVEVMSATVNLISDVLILVLPQPIIWKLNMSTQRKIGISIVFTIGIL
jgi:hypothetical protein